MSNLVLSLFPGIGLLDLAFELEGFCTVRGPDVIWGGDVRTFHPPAGKFDGVIGGPPCQSFSSLVHLVRANGNEPTFGNLIPEFERCVAESEPAWFVMENVPAAPEPCVAGYGVTSFLLDNSMLDAGDGHGREQRRVRRFCFGQRGVVKPPDLRRWIDLAVFVLPDASHPVTAMHDSIENLNEWSKARRPAVTSTDGGITPSEKARVRHATFVAGHDKPPSQRPHRAATSTVTSNVGGKGKHSNTPARRYRLADALRLQGLPETHLDHCPMTAAGKLKAVANGVPISMGRAIAKAVREAIVEGDR